MEMPSYPSLEGSTFYGIFSSPDNSDGVKWTVEENKLFEDALAEFSISSPEFFENVAARVPQKTVKDVKKHYETLVEDLKLIESGQFPVPEFKDKLDSETRPIEQEVNDEGRGGKQLRKRGLPWTEEEHQLFLMGLNKYGKGDWRSISRYYVISKTPTQVASHAQKYFRRQNSATPVERRRPSIHDIQTVHPISAPHAIVNSGPTLNNNVNMAPQIISNFAPQNPNFYPTMPYSVSAPFPPPSYMNQQNVQTDHFYNFSPYRNNQQPWA